ncbi:MAG TPA: hypothetical protein VFN39_13140, partial [Gemmatimonadaceae bacterium]|nr:hypothetical protein [Gemmatimonadaceae bacterium]
MSNQDEGPARAAGAKSGNGDRAAWRAVRVRPAGDRAVVAAALFSAGSQGVHDDGPALVTHFPPATDLGAV